ncbi:MAG TPA: DUF5916 domain-containing protein [Vicinamibacteria bacterium]|nr:DUF5916 domain-containing protein [Vicinamibacteria bacterium]
MSALLALLLAGAAPEPPVMTAVPATGELHVDGRLDEPDWARARPAAGFRQREPHEGEPATQPTEVRVLFDARNLYIGVLARDAEPQGIVAHLRQRDTILTPTGFDDSYEFAGDDAVAILLDPFRDKRNAVVFATNPNGAEFDALITDESGAFNAEWRAVWTVRAQRVPEGWSAEISIPFRSLRYPSSSPDGWGINVWRMMRRRNEETLWTAWSRDGGGFPRVSQAGRLLGLTGLPRTGLNLEVKPYGLAGLTQEPGADGTLATSRDRRLGLDAKWEVRPGLVLDGTIHPDFAQVEADDERVNLTRFDLFFPEKRDFFLENAGIFDFGWRGQDETPPFLLFFSRRIGIAEDDESLIPVRGGVRLSGRVGGQTVGLLDVYTEAGAGQPAANHGVVRVKRDLGNSSYLGGMLVDRRDGERSNTAGGLDASFWPAETVNLQAFAARTWTDGRSGNSGAWRVSGDYSGDRVGLSAQHLVIEPGADPQVGFVTRTDIRRTDALARYTLRPSALGLRRIDLFAEGQYIARTTGEKQDAGAGPTLNLEWNSGDSVAAFYFQGSSRIDEPFLLSDRIPVPAGDYDVRHWSFSASSARRRPVTLSVEAERMDSFGGRLVTLGGRTRLSPGSHLSLELGFTHDRVTLPLGAFTAEVSSARLVYAFTTRLFVSALVQHNSLDRKLLTNVRLNFIHRPGSDLFLVFNEDRGDGVSLRPVAHRGFAMKLSYLARF